MAKPKTVTPHPPSSGQDYVEMDRIPPRRGNPKEAQRTVAIVVGSLVVLAVGVGLRETVYKPHFTTPAAQESSVTTASSKETVTDIPTGFTQGPAPIRVRTPAAKAGRTSGAPVPSPFGRPGTTSASNAAPIGNTATAETAPGTGGYDPFGAVRNASSQPTVSLTPRNGTTDTDTTGAPLPYIPSTTTAPTGGGYTPTYGTSSLGTSGNNAVTTAAGRGGSGTGYGTGTGSTSGGPGSSTGSPYGSGSYGSNTSGNSAYGGSSTYGSSPYTSPYGGNGTSGTGTGIGGYSGAPR